ncbi:hypothetical protein [Marinifilum sp. D714]|uniref:hypothetical protein n=1 Tax=Marinifilum sp. D714 TaxID=2937523 RepID=UPI0027CC2C25|nr:hypothetical protein [Marinifilum sp. D714]MDQ2179673.1 hypothetical protein [Marinifilum sp. D714]
MRKVLIIAMTLIFVWSCSKDQDELIPSNSNDFFAYSSIDNPVLDNVVSFLQKRNEIENFTSDFSSMYGDVIWDENITIKNEEGFVMLIPTLLNQEVEGIWLFDCFKGTINYAVIVNDQEVRQDKHMDYNFAYFEQTLLNKNDKYKFIEPNERDYNIRTKEGAHIIEHCRIVKTGNDVIGWEVVEMTCWEEHVPGTVTGRYMYENYDDQVGGGQGDLDNGGGSNSDSNSEHEPDPEVKEELEKFDCASEVFNSFSSFDNTISNLLSNTFGNSHNFHIIFKGAKLDANVDGNFDSVDGTILTDNTTGAITEGTFVIKINEFVLNNSTKEYIAVTYAHETIHALIAYYKINNPQKGKELFPIFYETFEYEDGDHLTMGNMYVDEMVDIIMQINPNMPYSDATCLAWQGLQNTRAYDLKKNEYDNMMGQTGAWDQLMIKINKREKNGDSKANGTKCVN